MQESVPVDHEDLVVDQALAERGGQVVAAWLGCGGGIVADSDPADEQKKASESEKKKRGILEQAVTDACSVRIEVGWI